MSNTQVLYKTKVNYGVLSVKIIKHCFGMFTMFRIMYINFCEIGGKFILEDNHEDILNY